MRTFIFLLLCLSVSVLSAAVIQVPGDQATIADAYTAAVSGDTIMVAAGTYSGESITITKDITLLGANYEKGGTAPDRAAETVWEGGSINLGHSHDCLVWSVTIKGFKIVPQSAGWMGGKSPRNIWLENNIVDGSTVSIGSNKWFFLLQGGVNYDVVIRSNWFVDGGNDMFFFGGGGGPCLDTAIYDRLLIQNNQMDGSGLFGFWAASKPSGVEFSSNEVNGPTAMNFGPAGDIKIKDNTFKNCFYTAFQCGIEGGEITGNKFLGCAPYPGFGSNLFQLFGGEWGTPSSNNVLVSGNEFHYNTNADGGTGPRLRPGVTAGGITFENNKWFDGGVVPDCPALYNQSDETLYVGINDWNSPDGYAAHAFKGPIEFPGAWIYNGQLYYTPSIGVTVWNDVNLNGVIDADEKGLEGIEVSLPKADKLTKHLTREKGQCTFKNLEFGEFTLTVDDGNLPAGVVCTTGDLTVNVTVDAANNFPQVEIGLAGDGLESLSGDDVIDPRPQDVTAAPNDLVFVEGTMTGTDGKHDMGWANAVDKDVEGNDGTVWAKADAATGEDVPWAIFEFGDQGLYKFNYAKFQTDNGTDDDAAKNAYQVTKIEVLVSEDGMMADDFESVGTFNLKYGTDKLQWCTLGDYVTAKYVKLRLLNPVVEGKWTQIVEFALDTSDKTGPVAASDTDQFAVVPESMELLSNYPNPFNPTTTIEYAIPKAAQVHLTVYDVTGKQVAELVNSYQASGAYTVQFDASDLPSGMYFCTIQAGSFNQTRRMMLIK